MFETPLTIVGRIVTTPERRRVGDQDVVKFRVASNARRRGPDGEWGPGNSLFLSVNCWGKLGINVIASVSKGDAVIVTGQVYTNEYDDREGVRRSSVEIRATAVGPDLTWYIARTEKMNHPESPSATADSEPPTTESDDSADTDISEPLPLSA